MRFIIGYININQQLFCKTYPLTRIGDNMNKLEPYQYATAFYLNMGATQYNLMHREIIWQPLQLN